MDGDEASAQEQFQKGEFEVMDAVGGEQEGEKTEEGKFVVLNSMSLSTVTSFITVLSI